MQFCPFHSLIIVLNIAAESAFVTVSRREVQSRVQSRVLPLNTSELFPNVLAFCTVDVTLIVWSLHKFVITAPSIFPWIGLCPLSRVYFEWRCRLVYNHRQKWNSFNVTSYCNAISKHPLPPFSVLRFFTDFLIAFLSTIYVKIIELLSFSISSS